MARLAAILPLGKYNGMTMVIELIRMNGANALSMWTDLNNKIMSTRASSQQLERSVSFATTLTIAVFSLFLLVLAA